MLSPLVRVTEKIEFPRTQMGKSVGEEGWGGRVRSFIFGHMEVVKSISHPSGDGELAVGCKSVVQRKSLGCRYRSESPRGSETAGA